MTNAQSEVPDEEEQTSLLSPERNEPLLRTKLFVPPVRSHRVTRSRLFEQVNSGLDKALILISAPAGYGKTTLVSSWLEETDLPSTWLSLDEDDNDPIRFLQYFITTLQKIVPSIQSDWLGVLQAGRPTSYKFLLNIIINEIAGSATPFALVLDDFHVLQAQPVLDLLAHFFDHLPPRLHVLLLSRTDPPLPLARLRARNQLIDIRADQLRFTRQEIALFLNEAMGLKLSSQDIIALETRTEGWIAGLQLASLALQAHLLAPGGQDVNGFISAFTGSQYYIMDYLAEEVLKLQTEPVRSFLLQSSILNRMCGPLCDEVVKAEQPGSANGQAMLATLEQLNLFIIPLDSERRWYRYHHLFADVLNRLLEQAYPQMLPDLHRRAARWYEENGFIFDAIRHTLLAGDQERAAHLVDQHGCQLLMRGEVVNLLHWIEAVEPYAQTLPWIAIQKGWALCLTSQLERAEGPLQTAAQLVSALPPTDEVGTMMGAVTAARAYRANMQGETRLAANLARQALDCLPVSSDFSCSLRSAATSILGDACWLAGDLVEAQRAYTDAVQISQAAGNLPMIIISNSNLAEVLLEQGQLQAAARSYAEALQMVTLPDGQISPLAESVYAGLGRIAYEWNHLAEAAKYIQQCLELSRRWGNFEAQALGSVLLARLEHAQGRPEKTQEAMRVAEQLISEHTLAPWRSLSLKCALARLWITQGDLEKTSYLVQTSGIMDDSLPGDRDISTQQAPLYLILLRLHQARGDDEAALALAERLLQRLDKTRGGQTVEVLVLQALAFYGKKNIAQAVAVLEKSFRLAQPEGYVRTFLDEGEPMAKLLYQAKSHRQEAGYAAELLSAMGNTFGGALPPATVLIEPLTLRELELLKLVEAGYSNQEIAARLVISMPTVKRHISNIYAKLGANSRTQAVSRGKELSLFK